MRRWIALCALGLLGCGSTARQAKRAAQIERAPSLFFVLARAQVEPVKMPCGSSELDLRVDAWAAASRDLTGAFRTQDRARIDDRVEALSAARAEWWIADEEFFKVTRCGPGQPDLKQTPGCRHASAFNHGLIEIADTTKSYLLALEAYSDALEKSPDTPIAEPPSPDYGRIADRFARLIDSQHRDAAAYLAGWAHGEAMRPEQARAAFAQVSSESPHAAEAALRIGLIDADAGRHAAAIDAFDRAIALDAEDKYRRIARYVRARSQYVVGDIEPAVTTLVALAAEEQTGAESARTAAFLLAVPWDTAPADVARVERLVPGETQADARVIRRTLEELLARDRFATARAIGDSARTRFAGSAALPGILRAWYRALEATDPAAAAHARARVLDALTPAWMAAHEQDVAALEAANRLIDDALEAAAAASPALAVESLRTRLDRLAIADPALRLRLAAALAPTAPALSVVEYDRAVSEGALRTAALVAAAQAAFKRIAPDDPGLAEAQVAHARLAPVTGHPAQRGATLMKLRRFVEAEAVFADFAAADPSSAHAPAALFNAAAVAEMDDRPGAARVHYERLVSRYPKSQEAERAVFVLALLSERALDYRGALRAFETYLQRYRHGEHVEDAAVNVVMLRSALGRHRAAADAALAYARRFPDAEARPQFERMAVRALGRAGKPERQRALLDELTRTRRPTDERVELDRVRARLAQPAAAHAIWARIARQAEALPDRMGRRAHLLGEAWFMLIEPDYQAWASRTPQWAGGSRALATAVKKELSAAKGLVNRYRAVIASRSPPWSVAAIYRTGRVYERFAVRLKAAPPLAGLSGEALDAYRRAVQSQAQPLMAQARQAFRLAVDKAAELGLQTEWTARARAGACRLGDCRPESRPMAVPVAQTAPLFGTIAGRLPTDAGKAAEAALRSALATAARGDLDAARAELARLLARHPALVEPRLSLGVLAEWTGASAADALATARRTPRGAADVAWIEALARLRGGEGPPPTDPDARLRIALGAPTDDVRSAIRQRAIDAPTNPRARSNQLLALLQVHPQLSRILDREDWSAAELDLLSEAVLRSAPPDDTAIVQHRARRWLKRALELPGGAPAAAYARLAWLALAAGQASDAVRLNREALRRRPGWTVATVNLGIAQWQNGDPAAARATLQGVDHPMASLNLGLVHLAEGNLPAARTWLKAYRDAVGEAVDPAFETWWTAARR